MNCTAMPESQRRSVYPPYAIVPNDSLQVDWVAIRYGVIKSVRIGSVVLFAFLIFINA